jgi:PAS domain S-box-containing protein
VDIDVAPVDEERARTEGYRELFDNAPIGIINVGLDGKPLLVNERAARTFGYTSPEQFLDEVPSLPALWVHPVERDRAAEILLSTGVLRDFEVAMLRRDGTRITISVSANPWRDRDGNVIGLQVCGIDITDRLRAERRLEQAQSQANIAFWTWRLATNEFVHTRNLADIVGVPRRADGLRMAELIELVDADDREMVAMRMATMDRSPGHGSEIEFRVIAPDGSVRWLIASGRVDDDGTQVSGFIQDITEQKRIREKLTELNDMKTEFVGVVAHDLRVPLTVATGYAEFLLGQWDDLDDVARKQFVERMQRSLARIDSLVSDVSEVTRLESGAVTVEAERFDLSALVHNAVEDVRSVDPYPTCTVRADNGLPPAFGDHDHVERVVSNLLSNAVKYAPGSPIAVELARDGEMLRVSVADRGPGIAPAELHKLFEKFSRLPALDGSARPPGSGLGLFICRSLVEAGGGRIWVESEPGRGTTFSFTVPAAGS